MAFDVYTESALEAAAREAIRLDEPRALLDRFVTLIRESGTPAEETAGRYIVERLHALGVPVTLHTPELYISLPERAELTLATSGGTRARQRTAAGDGAIDRRRAGRRGDLLRAIALRRGHVVAVRCARRGAGRHVAASIPSRAGSCSPKGSRCRGRSRRSNAAARSRRSTSIPASAFTKASARRSGARRRRSRSAASRRRRSSASIIRTARR